ncbi:MAG: immunoglobulin domain-containing protein, partial [Pseudomonadota bacterium]
VHLLYVDVPVLSGFAVICSHRYGVPANYTWTRENELPLPKGSELVDYNRRLIIHDIQPEDEGEYTCTVSANTNGADNSKSITLSVFGTCSFQFA